MKTRIQWRSKSPTQRDLLLFISVHSRFSTDFHSFHVPTDALQIRAIKIPHLARSDAVSRTHWKWARTSHCKLWKRAKKRRKKTKRRRRKMRGTSTGPCWAGPNWGTTWWRRFSNRSRRCCRATPPRRRSRRSSRRSGRRASVPRSRSGIPTTSSGRRRRCCRHLHSRGASPRTGWCRMTRPWRRFSWSATASASWIWLRTWSAAAALPPRSPPMECARPGLWPCSSSRRGSGSAPCIRRRWIGLGPRRCQCQRYFTQFECAQFWGSARITYILNVPRAFLPCILNGCNCDLCFLSFCGRL